LICDKIKGGVLFVVKKKGRRRRDRGGREGGGPLVRSYIKYYKRIYQQISPTG
jgi:hypothetical protein